MKLKYVILICISFFVLNRIKGQETDTKNFIVFSTYEGTPLEALPILDGTVIKFTGDSVVLKKDDWEDKIHKSELTNFEYLNDFRADMTVRVTTNDSLLYQLEGMIVTLHNEYNDDIFGIVNLTGENGETFFRNIPPGFYSIYIVDPNNNFESDALYGVHHGLPSTNELLAKEKVISPYLLHYNITASEKGFYDLWLEWESNANLTDYLYYIYLNDERIGVTSNQWYQISGLTPGEYEISVLAVSSYGNVSDAPRKITVTVEEYISEVELLPDDEGEKDSPYFDLLGRVVKNPLPGIYIHNGKKVLVK